ncbi:unnamed protein product [Urochloa humidicola]
MIRAVLVEEDVPLATAAPRTIVVLPQQVWPLCGGGCIAATFFEAHIMDHTLCSYIGIARQHQAVMKA